MKKRGRPRKFDQATALEQAAAVFWRQGYGATSLDDLGDAMNMNRPSIYNAFGDKQTIYRQSLAAFCGQLDRGIEQCLESDLSLRNGLITFFDTALALYCGDDPPLGCLMICTAPAECLNDRDVQADLNQLISNVDKALAKRIKRAVDEGELDDSADPKLLAMTLQSVLHGIAIRARAAESKRQLKKFVTYAVDSLPWME